MNSAFNQNSNGVSVVGVAGPAFVAEPPLSPPAPRAPQASVPQPAQPAPQAPEPERPVLEVAPAPTPAVSVAVTPAPVTPAPAAAPAEPPAPAGLPLEGLLLRFGLITTEQLTEAMRERSATGKEIATIVVERGWVDEAQVARVAAYAPAFEPEPPAEPPTEPEPAVELEPIAAEESEPVTPPAAAAPATGQRVKVFVRLTSGERVDAGTFDGLEPARARGAEIARTLAGEAPEWPFVAGRFLRPDTIVSLDVEPELSA